MLATEEESSVSCVTEDLDDETGTAFSDGGVRTAADTSVLDLLLDEISQEEEEGRARRSEEASSSIISPGQKRFEQWLEALPPSSSASKSHGEASSSKRLEFESRRQSVEDNEMFYEKLGAMLRDALDARNPSSSYSGAGDDNGEFIYRRVPSSSLAQLAEDIKHNLPVAMMSIVALLTCPDETDGHTTLKKSVMQILNLAAAPASSSKNEANADVAKTLEEFLTPFKVKLKKHTRMNKTLSEAFECYVNDRLESAKTQRRDPVEREWVKVSNKEISALLVRTDKEKYLNLSAEKLTKYAKRLQAYVWENLVQRCLKAIKSLTGLNLICSEHDDECNSQTDVLSTSLLIESQEEASQPEEPPADAGNDNGSQRSESSVEEDVILAAVIMVEEAQGLDEAGDDGSDSQRSDDSAELLRSSSDYASQPDSLNMSQTSLPRRSPEVPLAVSPDPYVAQLGGFANETYFSFGGGGSQSSSDGSDGGIGPTRKFRRLN